MMTTTNEAATMAWRFCISSTLLAPPKRDAVQVGEWRIREKPADDQNRDAVSVEIACCHGDKMRWSMRERDRGEVRVAVIHPRGHPDRRRIIGLVEGGNRDDIHV